MIWGTIRRKVSSSQVLGQAWKVRPAASAPNCYRTAPKEALFNGRGFECMQRSSYHIVLGSHVSKSCRVATSLMQTESFTGLRNRSFSSDSGDLVEAVVPFMGESITDGTLATFLKKPGDKVAMDEPIAQIETDKVTIDVVSPEAGVLQKFVAKEGETVEPGVKIAIISKSGEGIEQAAPSEKASTQPEPKENESAEKQVPKAEPAPVKEILPKSRAPSSQPPPKHVASEPILPPKDRERRVPMTRLRKRVAIRLKDSQRKTSSYDKTKEAGGNTLERFTEYICFVNHI